MFDVSFPFVVTAAVSCTVHCLFWFFFICLLFVLNYLAECDVDAMRVAHPAVDDLYGRSERRLERGGGEIPDACGSFSLRLSTVSDQYQRHQCGQAYLFFYPAVGGGEEIS